MEFSPKQKLAIQDDGNNLLVAAAAGSGKTSVLVERIKRLITEKDVDISSMLIVTFTRAAAGEMKNRLHNELGIDVSHADVCTYDSFAQKILKNYYQKIGLNPKLRICDQYRKTMLMQESVSELFKKLYEEDNEDFIYLLDHYADERSDEKVKDMILGFFEYVDTLTDPKAFIQSHLDGEVFDIEKLRNYVFKSGYENLKLAKKYYDRLEELLCENEMPKLQAKVVQNRDDLLMAIDCFERGHSEKAASLVFDFKAAPLKAVKAEEDAKKAIEPVITALNNDGALLCIKAAKGIFELADKDRLELERECLKETLHKLFRITLMFMDVFSSKKIKEGFMDFSDSTHYALKILENEDVRKELRDKYEYIFIDEYQDSNDVQEELINRIARDNNLFMVGDVKQSIYKFRHAKPELFLNRYESYKKGKKNSLLIDLNQNFRSKPWVIAGINNIFRNVMTRDSSGIDYDDDAALHEGGVEYKGSLSSNPKLYLISSKSDDESIDEEIKDLQNAEIESIMCADVIKDYLGREYYDSKTKQNKKLEYKDMVILLHKLKGIGETFYSRLVEAGIPVYIERNEGYFNTPEIAVLVNLLRIIDNPKQDVPFISVLHFPVFGFNSNELAKIRIKNNEKSHAKDSYYKAFLRYSKEETDLLSKKCRELLEKLSLWRLKEKAFPISDFLWMILYESGIMDFVSCLKDSDQRLANIRALADKASEYEKQNLGGLYGFIKYVDTISNEDKFKTGQTKILNENDNVVRIMTIHASKGLEFPFVMISSLSSRLAVSKAPNAVYDSEFGCSVTITNRETFSKSVPNSLKIIHSKAEADDRAERIRLMYVAATRAKDFLVFTSIRNKADSMLEIKDALVLKSPYPKTYLDMILPNMDKKDISIYDCSKLSLPEAYTLREDDLKEKLKTGFIIDEDKSSLSLNEIKRRLDFEYTDDSVLDKKRKYSVSEIAAEQNGLSFKSKEDFKIPLFLNGERRLDSASLGTAYHKVMEHIPFNQDHKKVDDIKSFIEDLWEKGILSEEEKDAIKAERIAAFFDSDIGKKACSSKYVRKESPFVLRTKYDDREVLVQGTIDCFFEDEKGLVLLDYKSNYININKPDEGKQRIKLEYKPQLDLYKEALEKITGKKVTSAYLFSFTIGEFLDLC